MFKALGNNFNRLTKWLSIWSFDYILFFGFCYLSFSMIKYVMYVHSFYQKKTKNLLDIYFPNLFKIPLKAINNFFNNSNIYKRSLSKSILSTKQKFRQKLYNCSDWVLCCNSRWLYFTSIQLFPRDIYKSHHLK